MSTLVIFYSFSGKTKRIASDLAKKENADLFEVKAKKPYNIFTAFLKGAPAAMKQKHTEVADIKCDFSRYDKVIALAPVWGGFPAPPFNAFLRKIPKGKEVGIIMVSGGGTTKDSQKIIEFAKGLGLNVTEYKDIKAPK